MIELVGEEGKKGAKIRFTPRQGFRDKVKPLELDLSYGHVCPTCNNVIQAFFTTPEKVNLWPYEATTVLSQGEKNMGEILKIYPDEKADADSSCYRSYFYRTPNGQAAQKIVLKNHLMRVELIQDANAFYSRDKLWEVGERTCPMAGVFSIREDILLKDLCVLFRFMPSMLEEYNLPGVKQMLPDPKGIPEFSNTFKWIPAVGEAPPVIITERNTITQGYDFWLKEHLKPFLKPKATAASTSQGDTK